MTGRAADTLYVFVDEAGDPTLFANRRRAVVGSPGCSPFFILGRIEVDDRVKRQHRLAELRNSRLANPNLANVPAFEVARDTTSVMFHAKDVVPEVRCQIFKLLGPKAEHCTFGPSSATRSS
jgi:hypothetical protein